MMHKQTKWTWLLIAAFLLAGGGAYAAVAELKVQVIPQGELQPKDLAAEISITFDQAMVPLGMIQKDYTPDFVTLTPAVKGRFYWAGDRILMFHPENRLPYATAFLVTIKKEARSLSGVAVPRDLVFGFETPAPAMLRASAADRRDRGLVWKRDKLLVLFNQPVSRQEVEAKMKLLVMPASFQYTKGYSTDSPEALARIQRLQDALQAKAVKPAEIALTVFDERENGLGFVVTPASDIPLNGIVRLVMPAGFKGSEGPIGAKKAQALDFQTPKTLLYAGISCKSCKPDFSTHIAFTNRVRAESLIENLRVTDITSGAGEELKPRAEDPAAAVDSWYSYEQPNHFLCLLDSIYDFKAEHRYRLEIQPGLQDDFGLTLGIAVKEEFAFQPHPANLQLINNQGIIESSGPKYLSLRVMNVDSARFRLWNLPDEEIPRFLFGQEENRGQPRAAPVKSSLLQFKTQRNVSTIVNVNIEKMLGAREGIIFAAFNSEGIKPGIADVENSECEGILQVTDIAISCKYSMQNSLVYATSFSSGKPIADCDIKIVGREGRLLWQGRGDERGLCLAPGLEQLGLPLWGGNFVVIARKGSDRAFLSSMWEDGIEGWSFNLAQDEREQAADSMGYIFTDRGAYRPGEEVFVKAIFRLDRDNRLILPPGGEVLIQAFDSRDKEFFKKEHALNAFGSVSFSFKLPAEIPSGYCRIQVTTPESWTKQAFAFSSEVIIAEFRKPDFRVDVSVRKKDCYPGQNAEGTVSGQYLFGAPMKNCALRWTLRASPTFFSPDLEGDLAGKDFIFEDSLGEREYQGSRVVAEGQGKLDAKGEFPVSQVLSFSERPQELQLEGEVTDTTEQAIANRATMMLHPSEVYVGLLSGGYFAQKGKDFETAVIAADISGRLVAGKAVKVELTRREWHSVQEKQEGGYYRYRSEPVDTVVKTLEVTTGKKPLTVKFSLDQAGYYMLRGYHTDGRGNTIKSSFDFYCIGDGFTPWERYDHNRMDLVPEKSEYNPGQKARILVKSPWTEAQGIVTIERSGIIDTIPVALKGSTQVLEILIKKEYIPTAYVSVLLVKGRSADKLEGDVDVGKPTFRLGYTKLDITPDEVYLRLDLQSDKTEYKPKEIVNIKLQVNDFKGAGKKAEITLYAVDYGVLSLTGYKLPDPVAYFYSERNLGVKNAVSYLTLISRDYLKGKLAEEAGGGGMGDMFEVRKDFRVTPFWRGDLVTDDSGKASASFTLPDFLTTFTVMAVAQTSDSYFGSAKREIRVSKPLILFPALPRFLIVDDRCQGAVRVQNNLDQEGKLVVRAESLNQKIELGEREKTLKVDPRGSVLVKFPLKGLSAGREKLRFYALLTVDKREERDAIEVDLPVSRPQVRIDAATYGSTDGQETVKLKVPEGIDPGAGGLRITASSSALAELEKSSEFLFEYPFGCTEQLTSRLVPFLAAKNLAGAFKFTNLKEKGVDGLVYETLGKIYKNQAGDGGFGFWSNADTSFPYISSYVLYVFRMAENRNYSVDRQVRDKLIRYLKNLFRSQADPSAVTLCSRAFALYALALWDAADPSAISLLYEKRNDLPLFARAFLLGAAGRTKGSSLIRDTLLKEITNAARIEAASVHFEEGYFAGREILMHSDLRSNAIILEALLQSQPDSPFSERLVAWILSKRKNGAWRNTQENSHALIALSEYFRVKEGGVVDFIMKSKIEGKDLPPVAFKDIRKEILNVTMAELGLALKDRMVEVNLAKEGKGRLYWGVNLSYYPVAADFDEVNQGFSVQRVYEDLNSGQKKGGFKTGDLIRVRLILNVTAERTYVALVDPIPAGTEIENTYLQTTSRENLRKGGNSSWYFYHTEPYDDRMQAFADRLPQGTHEFVYVLRATTSGSFLAPAAKAEEMYNPEVFGISRGSRFTIE